jgi:hypothetical protein
VALLLGLHARTGVRSAIRVLAECPLLLLREIFSMLPPKIDMWSEISVQDAGIMSKSITEYGELSPEEFDNRMLPVGREHLAFGDHRGRTLMRAAVVENNVPLIHHLAVLEPRLVRMIGREDVEPIHLATLKKHKACIAALLARGANINACTFGLGPHCLSGTPLDIAVYRGATEIVDFIRDAGGLRVDPVTLTRLRQRYDAVFIRNVERSNRYDHLVRK